MNLSYIKGQVVAWQQPSQVQLGVRFKHVAVVVKIFEKLFNTRFENIQPEPLVVSNSKTAIRTCLCINRKYVISEI